MENTKRDPTLLQAFLPIIVLIALLVLNRIIYGDDTLGGSNQMTLLIAAAVAALIAGKIGYKWDEIFDGIVKSISSAMPALIILLIIGALAGTWLLSGIVPAMIYYGLEILNPSIFLFATCVVCAVVSLATGSSWSTVATVGIALLGIGKAYGLGEGLIAGAIISGAYFGDKMSPLSDTTNLAPAMAGTDLITRIKYMMYTTIPSFSIALILFLIIGFTGDGGSNSDDIAQLQSAITEKFNITPWLFLVPVGVIFMIIKKVPAVPALLAGAFLGGIFGIIFQPDIIVSVAGISNDFLIASYKAVVDAMTTDISVTTSNEMINDLLSTSGMAGMLNTIWLIICAMSFGGAMEATGMLRKITGSIIGYVKSDGSLIAATAGSSVFFNLTASDQYLAIVVPGKMFSEEFKDRKLAPEVLSRTLEDTGTVTSAIIPWNTCGAYHAGVLGVATGTYLPYAFFNLISPIMTVVVGYVGWKIRKIKD
ncbi:MAG: Na+/H+ antiporter NhaC [Flavobacteriales bacterium]|nr:Na+/H+ antiporter NhaC [Flavobacteriales bacterium]